MKKILAIMILSLIFNGNIYAESRLIETKDHKAFRVSTFCIDGYKFVTTNDVRNDYEEASGINETSVSVSVATALSMVQFFEIKDGKSLPARC